MKRAALRSLLQTTWLHRAAGWRRFALSLTADDADADDLVSEAVTRTLATAPTLRDERGLNNYVLKAIRNTWSNWTRSRKHERQLYDRVRREADSGICWPLQALIEAEGEERLRDVVAAALEKMEPEIRQVAVLYVVERQNLRLVDIAEIQGVSVSAAHERAKKALRILGQELKPGR